MAKAVLKVFDTPLSICSLRVGAPLPNWIKGDFICVVKTGRELSVVCAQDAVPRGVQVQDGFVRISVCQVEGEPFTGLLNRIAHALEEENIPLMAVSSYVTDHVLIPQGDIIRAVVALENAGFTVEV